jgi:hypothetical protein
MQEGGNAGVKEGSDRRGHDIAKPKRKINEKKTDEGGTTEQSPPKKEKKERKQTKNNWACE